jgi:hypothetical protein
MWENYVYLIKVYVCLCLNTKVIKFVREQFLKCYIRP